MAKAVSRSSFYLLISTTAFASFAKATLIGDRQHGNTDTGFFYLFGPNITIIGELPHGRMTRVGSMSVLGGLVNVSHAATGNFLLDPWQLRNCSVVARWHSDLRLALESIVCTGRAPHLNLFERWR